MDRVEAIMGRIAQKFDAGEIDGQTAHDAYLLEAEIKRLNQSADGMLTMLDVQRLQLEESWAKTARLSAQIINLRKCAPVCGCGDTIESIDDDGGIACPYHGAACKACVDGLRSRVADAEAEVERLKARMSEGVIVVRDLVESTREAQARSKQLLEALEEVERLRREDLWTWQGIRYHRGKDAVREVERYLQDKIEEWEREQREAALTQMVADNQAMGLYDDGEEQANGQG